MQNYRSGHEWWRAQEPRCAAGGREDPHGRMTWRVRGILLYDVTDCAQRLQRIWAELTDFQAARLAGEVALLCQAVASAEAAVERRRTEARERAHTAGRLAEAHRVSSEADAIVAAA